MTILDESKARERELADAIHAVLEEPANGSSVRRLCDVVKRLMTPEVSLPGIGPLLEAAHQKKPLPRTSIEMLVDAADTLLDFYSRAIARSQAVSERDVWMTANLVVQQYQEGATLHAAQRADKLLDKGDLDGALTWRRILRAINQLQSPVLSEGGALH